MQRRKAVSLKLKLGPAPENMFLGRRKGVVFAIMSGEDNRFITRTQEIEGWIRQFLFEAGECLFRQDRWLAAVADIEHGHSPAFAESSQREVHPACARADYYNRSVH
jgi:hypothetical protein